MTLDSPPATPHPIDRYCASISITRAELARRLGKSSQYLCDIVAGRTRIGGRTAEKLVKLSKGSLSYGELFEWRAPEEMLEAPQ